MWFTTTPGKLARRFRWPATLGPDTESLPEEGKIADLFLSIATKRVAQETKATTKAAPRSSPQQAIKHERSSPKEKSDYDKIMERIGLPTECMPSVTLGDLSRIAGIDSIALHSYLCFDRDLPESAFDNWREFFEPYAKDPQRNQPNRFTERIQESQSNSRSMRKYFADKLNMPVASLPQLTNGEIMRIAEVDITTLHGWTYANRSMPEAAMEKLEQFYAGHFRPNSAET